MATPIGYDLDVDTIEQDLSQTENVAYGDGSTFSGDMYETRISSGSIIANDFNFLLVNVYNEAGPPTNHHGIVGLSAKPFEPIAELLVKAWADAGAISKSMFSINY